VSESTGWLSLILLPGQRDETENFKQFHFYITGLNVKWFQNIEEENFKKIISNVTSRHNRDGNDLGCI
jgi:hypothetical protein